MINFKKRIEIFSENITLTRHNKHKVIDFDPINKSLMANKLPWTNYACE